MSDLYFSCPRREEAPFTMPGDDGKDKWREDNTCSYCGSLNQDTLMDRLEKGDVSLGPTDKNYKVYVSNDGGDMFKQTYRDCSSPGCVPAECTHWVTKDREQTKFYFQHMSVRQKKRFVELCNEKKLKIGVPGHFYVLPYFMRR